MKSCWKTGKTVRKFQAVEQTKGILSYSGIKGPKLIVKMPSFYFKIKYY